MRISDILINLLIRDLRILDGIGKLSNDTSGSNIKLYGQFLNESCKIRFRWFTDKESKKMQWRDLTGPEKLRLFKKIRVSSLFPYGNITKFTQQGLEKLNDLTTIHFQRASNHREMDAFRQVLEKRNRLEKLEDDGYARSKEVQRCSSCKGQSHNKRTCASRSEEISRGN